MRVRGIGRLVDLVAQLEADRRLGQERLRRRDRELGRELAATRDDARVAAWLERVGEASSETAGGQVERVQRLGVVVLIGLGLVLGAGLAAALFHYDGTHPVNVVRVVAVFVALQLALVVATLVLCLPVRWHRFVPGLAALQDALSLLSPGRMSGLARRWFSGPQRAAADRWVGLAERHHKLYGNVERWWLLRASQGFAVAFHIGAMVAAFSLVAFTDLAFGWSTTLDVDRARFAELTRVLSRPWASVWAEAVPSRELIDTTQYFRADVGHIPEKSAPWWPFVLSSMLVYGWFPRMLLLGFSHWRFRVALNDALLRIPGVAALRDRLDHALVETAAASGDEDGTFVDGAARGSVARLEAGVPCRVVIWAALPIDSARLPGALGVDIVSLTHAGEGVLSEDTAAIATLVSAGGDEPMLVLVKAWEPPVLEFLDFIGDLRQALGEDRIVLVVPVAVGDAGGFRQPRDSDAAQWRRALERLGDPFTQLHVPARLET